MFLFENMCVTSYKDLLLYDYIVQLCSLDSNKYRRKNKNIKYFMFCMQKIKGMGGGGIKKYVDGFVNFHEIVFIKKEKIIEHQTIPASYNFSKKFLNKN